MSVWRVLCQSTLSVFEEVYKAGSAKVVGETIRSARCPSFRARQVNVCEGELAYAKSSDVSWTRLVLRRASDSLVHDMDLDDRPE